MKNKSNQISWFEKEIRKDEVELENEKNKLIQQIKKLGKEQILSPKPKKLSIWQRIMKVLMG